MAKIIHNLQNTIKEQLNLALYLDLIDERRKYLLEEISFDILFGYEKPSRLIEKIIYCYSDKSSEKENDKLINDLIKFNELT